MSNYDERIAQLSPQQRKLLELQLKKEGIVASHPPITRNPEQEEYEMSYGQERLWFLDQLQPANPAYNLHAAIWLAGPLEVEALHLSISLILSRHLILNARFLRRAGRPVALIPTPTPALISLVDLTSLDDPLRHTEALRIAQHLASQGFDLASGPLWRAVLVRCAAQDHLLILTFHHIIFDEWSRSIFINELSKAYDAYSSGRRPQLDELPIQYTDYAQWQRGWLKGELLDGQLAFWSQLLADAPFVLDLPTDRARPARQSARADCLAVRLDDELIGRLREFGRQQGATLYMVLLMGFGLLLSRYSNQREVLIGTPVANRSRQELEGLIGFFVNTLVLPVCAGDATVRETISQVKRTAISAFANQDLPFEKLVEHLQPRRDQSRSPLFQVMFILQNIPMPRLELPGLRLEPLPLQSGAAKFDLTLALDEQGGSVGGYIEYDRGLFERATIERLAGHLLRLLRQMADHLDRPVSQLQLLDPHQRHQLIQSVNTTARRWPRLALHQLIAAQAATRPEAIAVSCEDEQVSYGQLEGRANRLAHHLRGLGLGTDQVGAICLPPHTDRLVAMLAVMKAGAAYLPLEVTCPPQRLAFMLEESAARLLLCHSDHPPQLETASCEMVFLDRLWPELAGLPEVELDEEYSEHSLAYVIYTSGSTGLPKGVMIAQAALTNFILAILDTLPLRSHHVVIASTSLAFDIAALELLAPLAAGARCVIASADQLRDPLLLQLLATQSQASILQATPTLWRLLARTDLDWLAPITALSGGEPLDADLARRLTSAAGAAFNLYGPTETTVWSTAQPLALPLAKVLIGTPIANTSVFVLDPHLQLVAPRLAGQLFIGGLGLARGYMRRPDLTADAFRPDPFSRRPGQRLYRTGDRAAFEPDGRLALAGRTDRQVKLRGFRIELGEIEAALRRHPAVAEAIVIVDDADGDRRLLAYVEGPPAEFDEAALRRHLRQSLPDYMVPARLHWLARLPLTVSGKLDRQALRSHSAPPLPPAAAAAAPALPPTASRLLQQLAEIWAEVLGLAEVSPDANFFDLGGHSLKLVEVQALLDERLARQVSLLDLFTYPTLNRLAGWLSPESTAAALADAALADAAGLAPALPPAASDDDKIAIIAISGRFPGAADLDQFWQLLADGREAITRFSHQQLLDAGLDADLIARPDYVAANALLDGVDLFDAELFATNPREAQLIDPQQRLFLEVAFEALDRAGYNARPARHAVGVFAGASPSTYLLTHLLHQRRLLEEIGGFRLWLANDKDHLAMRASYKLGLGGPSLTVQTACSTSLVAVHLACQAIRRGECDMALAGAVSLKLPQRRGYLAEAGGILSADGHCRAFDAAASGTVSGDGVGVVLLKRLRQALADGDPIQAVILGSAINNDGALKAGYTAPSVEGQAEVISRALAAARVAADSISYIEGHGSGTPLGDRIELAALRRAYGAAATADARAAQEADQGAAQTAAPQWLIGSVKSNIGHLDTAAGIAGLIKTVLALKHQQLPASLHVNALNPQLADWPAMTVNRSLRPWSSPAARPRRAAVSSFGQGGTNAHLILEEAPALPPSGPSRHTQMLMLSARSLPALKRASAELAAHLQAHADLPLADVAYTLQVGRRAQACRQVVVGGQAAAAIAALSGEPAAALAGEPAAALISGQSPPLPPEVIFLLSGLGEHYDGLGRQLYADEAAYRQAFDEVAEAMAAPLGADLRELLYGPRRAATAAARAGDGGGLRHLLGRDRAAQPRAARSRAAQPRALPTAAAQAAIFAIDYSLARLLMCWGIRPDALIGYSLGEYVAAALAGVYSLADAARLVACRGHLLQRLPRGAMLAVSLSPAELRTRLGQGLWLAAHNGPEMTVAGGPAARIASLERRLKQEGVTCRRLRVRQAFHTPMMSPARQALDELAGQLKRQPGHIRYVSNLTGKWMSEADWADGRYWGRHLCEAVSYWQGLEEVVKGGGAQMIVEVGPGPMMSSLARQVAGEQARVVSTMVREYEGEGEQERLLKAVAGMWVEGVEVDWASYYGGERRRRVELPVTVMERESYWLAAVAGDEAGQAVADAPPVAQPGLDHWFYVSTWKRLPLINLSELDHLKQQKKVWLIFKDRCGLSLELAEELELLGQQVIFVECGERFEKIDANAYTINMRQAEDYEALLQSLSSSHRFPDKIVHLWSVTGEADDARPLDLYDDLLARGFFSLILLAQALAAAAPLIDIALFVLADHLADVSGLESLSPIKATLLGPARVIPQEFSHLSCRLLDLGSLAAARAAGLPPLARRLLADFAASSTHPLVAWRGPHRWVQAFEPLPLLADPATPPPATGAGLFLITGGLGGIGLTLAEALLKQGPCRLVLTSRSPFPPRRHWPDWLDRHPHDDRTSRRIRQLLRLDPDATAIEVATADSADLSQMRALLDDLFARHARLDGLIHAAGLAGGALIERLRPQAAAEVLRAKVKGGLVLAELLADRQVGWVAYCSSVSALLGGIGEADYCAANAFLDHLALQGSRLGQARLAINWGMWKEVGLAVETDLPESLRPWRQQHLQAGISPEQGAEAFRRLAGRLEGQVVVTNQGLAEQLAWHQGLKLKEAVAALARQQPAASRKHGRPKLSSAYQEPASALERGLAGIWEEMLGIEGIGTGDNFFELGGHSLLGAQVMGRVRKAFAVELGLRALFEAPTLAELALVIEDKLIDEIGKVTDDDHEYLT